MPETDETSSWYTALLAKAPSWLFAGIFIVLVLIISATPFLGPFSLSLEKIGFQGTEDLPMSGGKESMPVGAVVAFTDLPVGRDGIATCPESWTEAVELRGRFVIGSDPANPYGNESPTGIASIGGTHEVTLTESQMPEHAHVPDEAFRFILASDGTGTTQGTDTDPEREEPNLARSRSLIRRGGNQPHTNMPPYIALTWCRRI